MVPAPPADPRPPGRRRQRRGDGARAGAQAAERGGDPLGRGRLRPVRGRRAARRPHRARVRAAQGRRLPGRLRLDRPARPEPRGGRGGRAGTSSCTRWPSRTPSTPTSGQARGPRRRHALRRAQDRALRRQRGAHRDRRGDGLPRRRASWSPSATARAARCTTCAWTSRRTPTCSGIGPSSVLYAIADRVVDDYRAVIDGIAVDVEEVEAEVFSGASSNPAERIYRLKREVLEFRRAVTPLIAPMQRLASKQAGLPLDPRTGEYFRDVHDHLLRDAERIAGFDELLTNALQANVAQITMRDNQDMRRISAWVAIIAVPTMVFGLYGMNFEHMPELRWTYGYPAVVVRGPRHLRGPVPQVQGHRLALSILEGSVEDVDARAPVRRARRRRRRCSARAPRGSGPCRLRSRSGEAALVRWRSPGERGGSLSGICRQTPRSSLAEAFASSVLRCPAPASPLLRRGEDR